MRLAVWWQVPVWLLRLTRSALRGFQWARDAADRLVRRNHALADSVAAVQLAYLRDTGHVGWPQNVIWRAGSSVVIALTFVSGTR